MGWLSDKLFGKRKSLNINKIKGYMQPAQDMVTQQAGYAQGLIDPNSRFNIQNRGLLQMMNRTQGQQIGNQMQKMGAMTGTSPAQAMMQARMGMNQSMGQGAQNAMQNTMQNQMQGFGMYGQALGNQMGLSENYANAYVQQINASNAARQNRVGQMFGLAGAALGGLSYGPGGD
mgnify:CR=1 FL=1